MPEIVKVSGSTFEMSPLLVAVRSVLFAFVIVTTEMVLGLRFFVTVNVAGADKTHGAVGVGVGVGVRAGVGVGVGVWSVVGVGVGVGSEVGGGVGVGVGVGVGDVSSVGVGVGVGVGEEPSCGEPAGMSATPVGMFEFRVTVPISRSSKISEPIVTSPAPERLI